MPLNFSNMMALSISRYIGINQSAANLAMSQLTSGKRIVNASVDPAGLAISNNLSAQILSMSQAQRNAGDGVSLAQVADGSLEQIGSLLSRMRELAVQGSNGIADTNAAAAVNSEFVQLRSEVDRISATTSYDNTNLLDGTLTNGVSVQVGVNGGANNTVAVSIGLNNSTVIGNGGLSAQTLGAAAADTQIHAQTAIATVDQAISQINAARANLGGAMTRLQAASDNLGSEIVNYSTANMNISSVDVASAMADLAKNQIQWQAGIALFAQANGLSANTLSLIQRATGG